MVSQGGLTKKIRPVYNLRDKNAFDNFVNEHTFCIIVAYHYICPECESYNKLFKKLALEYSADERLNFAKIHIQFKWMIKDAKLTGDVKEENTFIKNYGVGKAVPATMFFRDGGLVWKLEGVLQPPIFRGLVKKLLEGKEGNNDR